MINPCSQNAVAAYSFLVGKGLRAFQAAAIVGNLQQESGVNPRLEATDVNGLPSRGIAMWQPVRWQRLLTFAAGRDPWALETQLEFLWHELWTIPALGLGRLATSTTLEDATIVFQNEFERCGTCHTSSRLSYARNILACASPPSGGARVFAFVALTTVAAAAGFGVKKLRKRRRFA